MFVAGCPEIPTLQTTEVSVKGGRDKQTQRRHATEPRRWKITEHHQQRTATSGPPRTRRGWNSEAGARIPGRPSARGASACGGDASATRCHPRRVCSGSVAVHLGRVTFSAWKSIQVHTENTDLGPPLRLPRLSTWLTRKTRTTSACAAITCCPRPRAACPSAPQQSQGGCTAALLRET